MLSSIWLLFVIISVCLGSLSVLIGVYLKVLGKTKVVLTHKFVFSHHDLAMWSCIVDLLSIINCQPLVPLPTTFGSQLGLML